MSIGNIENIGKKIGSIPVSISYRIIELFSAGLYSSPNKAFEELVCNSYDAFANKVAVYVPSNITHESILWVCDNGESMDSDGLRILWKIGATNKRDSDYDPKDRLPIGKFGIGKLATYVLADKLTHICKSKGKYIAVTMDFCKIEEHSPSAKSTEPVHLELDEKLLTEQEVIDLLGPLIKINGKKLLDFNLWGKDAEESWTFVIMSKLKDKAQQIQEGRLKWILKTALPLSPKFNLYYNAQKLKPSKSDIKPIKKWTIGKNDKIVENFDAYSESSFNGKPCVNLPHLNNVHGIVELYRDSLVRGKSEELGRSHGIFLMVRGRLINLDDPLIGMAAMTHGVFNRFRMVVNADELDEYLTSTRESIKDSNEFYDLRKYVSRKFEEIKKFYFDYVKKEDEKKSASYKIWHASPSLSRRPLLTVVRKFFDGEITNLVLTDIPLDLTTDEQNKIIEELEEDLTSEKGIIEDVAWEPIGPENPVAKFDLKTRTAKINLLHPFFANFIDEATPLIFQLIAITEILTEASMIEIGIDQDTVSRIMWRRDQILRELTFSDKPNAPLVSQMLQAAVSDPSGLEDALFHVFNNLGFETTKIGGRGKPDGEAVAILGVRDPKSGEREDYSVIYDAKSTKRDKIKAKEASISGVTRHRDDYKADYAVIVAIDFEGADDPESAISKESKKHKINLFRAKDLMTLD